MSDGMKKFLGFAAIALVLFFVISQPGPASDLFHNILYWLRDAGKAIISFFTQVVKGN